MKKKRKTNKREKQRMERLSPYKYTSSTYPKGLDISCSSNPNFKLNKNGGLN